MQAASAFAAEAARLGLWELELATGILTCSALFKRNFGRDPDQPFTWEDVARQIHPDDRARRQAVFDHALATGADYELALRAIRPDGTQVWLQVRARVIAGPDGTPARVAGISMDITDRRRDRMLVELSEQSLRLATEAAEIGTWDLDLATDTLTWTERTRAMFGIAPDAACSMADFYAGLHPDDHDATAAAFAAALDPAVRATYDVEYRTIGRQDGILRWVAAKGRGLFEGGICHRAVGTAIDITARKLAEGRQNFLLALGERLRDIATPGEIIRLSIDGLRAHLGADRAGYGLFEADGETIVLDADYTVGPPLSGRFALRDLGPESFARQRGGQTSVCADIAEAAPPIRALCARLDIAAYIGVPLIRAERLRANMFVLSRTPRAWAPGDVALVEAIAARTWDLLERVRAEAALKQSHDRLERLFAERTAELRASEARMRTVFETSYQLQGLLTPDGILLDANAASLSAIGARLEDVRGRNFADTAWFAATPGMPELVRNAVAAAAGGENVRREVTVNLPGGPRSYDFTLRPVRDGEGRVVAIVPEALDTTDRRQAEEALRQAQKMEAIGQLTGGIAHDFNNLLGGIMGSVELIRRRVAAGRLAEIPQFTTGALTSAQGAAALIQRLLAFARRQPLDPQRVDANRLLSGMEDLLRRTLGPEIAVEMVLAGGLWPTLCDGNGLESAVLNLAINARDAMPAGGRLTIETANAHLDDAYVRSQGNDLLAGQYIAVAVTDTGAGMPPDVIARAFEPFFTTKPIGQGTGLGLSMLHGFVKQSNGHVRIYSEPGQGSTVKLYLPRHAGPAAALPASAGAAPASGATVLVVEDEATVRMLVVETLRELGHGVLEAADGTAGLRIVESDAAIDLLVSDVGLPGLNGRQLAEAARARRPGLKVLLMTGYAHNATLGDGLLLDTGIGLITKPFALAELSARVAAMMPAADG